MPRHVNRLTSGYGGAMLPDKKAKKKKRNAIKRASRKVNRRK